MSAVIARRYAQALMNLAAREKQIEEVAAGLNDVLDTLKNSPDLWTFAQDPNVAHGTKESVMTAVLQKAKVPTLVTTFVRFVVRKRRVALLEEMRAVFLRLADERLGRGQADVVVATTLTHTQQEHLRSRLEGLSGKTLTLNVTTEPSILGGVIARIGSTVWDGSLRNQLNQIRQSIIEG